MLRNSRNYFNAHILLEKKFKKKNKKIYFSLSTSLKLPLISLVMIGTALKWRVLGAGGGGGCGGGYEWRSQVNC